MTSTGPLFEPIRFYVGHHETKNSHEVNADAFNNAKEHGWDMITAPITNSRFHSRVLNVLNNYLHASEETETPLHSLSGQEQVPAWPLLSSLTPQDTLLGPDETTSQIIFTTSTWIDLASPDPLIADISRQVLALEVAYASFCGATNIMIQGPSILSNSEDGLTRYAHAIQEALGLGAYLQIHIRLPIVTSDGIYLDPDVGNLTAFARDEYVDDLGEEDEDVTEEIDEFATWDVWNSIRSMCKYNARLSIALTLSRNAPSVAIQSRWFSEPLRILNIPKHFFQSDVEPIRFSQAQTQLIWHYMRLRPCPWMLLSDTGSISGSDTTQSAKELSVEDDKSFPSLSQASQPFQRPHARPAAYLEALRRIEGDQPSRPVIELFGAGYQDYLQNPLQPLADNLESITYEVFEKDPIKYKWYERAVAAALRDWVATKKQGSGPENRIVCAVTGAGRGPLVTRTMEASRKTGIAIEMWAVEKNPNAYVLLQRHNATTWNNRVHLVQSDMRSWQGPNYSKNQVKVDILISELLGSLADNELSPECLDGVQHLLNPSCGISIPSSYTAHLTPIASPKIHADILARTAAGDTEGFSIPYVTMLHALDFLSARRPQEKGYARSGCGGGMPDVPLQPIIREAWEFKHPIPASHLPPPAARNPVSNANEHNERFARLEYVCAHRGVCHGLAGYFETVLYDPELLLGPLESSSTELVKQRQSNKIELSTNPLTMDAKSRDMISWFPMFLPLKTPLYFPDESLLVLSMWRRTDGRGVWYEWVVEVFKLERRKGGVGKTRRVRLGASEVVSSKESACKM